MQDQPSFMLEFINKEEDRQLLYGERYFYSRRDQRFRALCTDTRGNRIYYTEQELINHLVQEKLKFPASTSFIQIYVNNNYEDGFEFCLEKENELKNFIASFLFTFS